MFEDVYDDLPGGTASDVADGRARRYISAGCVDTIASADARNSDEMTVNSAPREEHFAPPDFEFAPATLLKETLALRGHTLV